MAAPTRTHYLNADFDLSLRPRPGQIGHGTLERQIRELTALALLGAEPRDAALVRVGIPDEFLDYLTGCGVTPPRVLMHPDSDPSTALSPFGWNAEAGELNRLHQHPVECPPLDCIRTVNSRSFALELERELFPESTAGALVESPAELKRLLAAAAPGSEWIVKSEHGNAGLANRRLRTNSMSGADRKFAEARLAEDDRLLIEPFLQRRRDWAMVFDVPEVASTLRMHETVCTSDGSMIGALFDRATSDALARDATLARAAERIAARLGDAGYFGPVCVDGFSHGDETRPDTRPLCDLNCRQSLSSGAFRLWRRLAPERTLYFRFFARHRLKLPDGMRDAVSALGDTAYDPGTRCGILFGSPTRWAGQDAERRPMKLATLFFAANRTDVFELERRFRERFEARR